MRLPANTPPGWYCLRITGCGGAIDATSDYFLLQPSPTLILAIAPSWRSATTLPCMNCWHQECGSGWTRQEAGTRTSCQESVKDTRDSGSAAQVDAATTTSPPAPAPSFGLERDKAATREREYEEWLHRGHCYTISWGERRAGDDSGQGDEGDDFREVVLLSSDEEGADSVGSGDVISPWLSGDVISPWLSSKVKESGGKLVQGAEARRINFDRSTPSVERAGWRAGDASSESDGDVDPDLFENATLPSAKSRFLDLNMCSNEGVEGSGRDARLTTHSNPLKESSKASREKFAQGPSHNLGKNDGEIEVCDAFSPPSCQDVSDGDLKPHTLVSPSCDDVSDVDLISSRDRKVIGCQDVRSMSQLAIQRADEERGGKDSEEGGYIGRVTLVHSTCAVAMALRAASDGMSAPLSQDKLEELRRWTLERELAQFKHQHPKFGTKGAQIGADSSVDSASTWSKWSVHTDMPSLAAVSGTPGPAAQSTQTSTTSTSITAAADSQQLVLEFSSCYCQWTIIASGLALSGSYTWTIPRSLEQGVYLVRVRGTGSSAHRLRSPHYPMTIKDRFEFVNPPPDSSDLMWEVRSTHIIEWRSFGSADKAELYLECANGTSTSLAHGLPASGSWEWAISARTCAGWYRLKVSSGESVQESSPWFQVRKYTMVRGC